MFYKKRIEELERKLDMLTRKLEINEAIGTVKSHSIGYTENNNRFLGEKVDSLRYQVRDNNRMIEDLFEHLDVYYFHVLEPQKKRLVKREEEGK